MANERRQTATELRAEQEARELAVRSEQAETAAKHRASADALAEAEAHQFFKTLTNSWYESARAVATKRNDARFAVLAHVTVDRATPHLEAVSRDAGESGFQVDITGLAPLLAPAGIAPQHRADPFATGQMPKVACDVTDSAGVRGWYPGPVPQLGAPPGGGAFRSGWVVVRW